MTLIGFVQRASILAGITFTSFSVYSSPAHSEPVACVIASNGKTVCGKTRAIERICVTTDGVDNICGKFKSFKSGKEEQERGQEQEAPRPIQGNAPRAVVNNISVSVRGCNKSDTTIKCSLSIRNKGADRAVLFYVTDSKITDSSGKTYNGSSIEVGGKKNSNILYPLLTSEIDYEAMITFENVPEGVRKAQVLSLSIDGKQANLRNIIFSN
jgi:hypothetical protein